jgi:hypothetical protein
MEAAVAEKEAEMTEWNDGRLDELSKRVDDGFVSVDKRFQQVDERFNQMDRKMDAGFARLENSIDALGRRMDAFHHVLFQGTVAMVVGVLGLLAWVIIQA